LGAEVVGFDLSYSVDEALEHLGLQERLHLVQADIYALPFKRDAFDYIYSIGVLHHALDTRRAFLSLLPILKKGGRISIWVYPHWRERNPGMRIYYSTSGFYRRLTMRMPKRLLHWLCHVAIPMYYINKLPYLGQLLHLMIPTSIHSDWRWRVLDTFDWYSPKYQHKHTYEEVVDWFEKAGLVDVNILSFPVSVTGKIPSVTQSRELCQ
jgi:SAM-dependent methyltransferase